MDGIENILYEDNHIIVVNKSSGINTQGPKHYSDLFNAVKLYIKEKYRKPGNVFLGLIHRLDRETSGIVIFARTSKAASRLSEFIRKKLMYKQYLGILDNIPNQTNGKCEDYLYKDTSHNIVHIVPKTAPKKSLAITQYFQVEKNLYSFIPYTGRPHQIRVHCANYLFPLWGDEKYGSKHSKPFYLHSTITIIPHPITRQKMIFTAKPPKKFLTQLRSLSIEIDFEKKLSEWTENIM